MQSQRPELNSGWTTVELQPHASPNATQPGCSLTDTDQPRTNFLDKAFGNPPNASAGHQYNRDRENKWDNKNRENLSRSSCVHGPVWATLCANPSDLPQSVRAQQQQSTRLDVAGDGSLSCSEPGASFPVPNSPMSPDRMMIIGLLLNVFSHGSAPVSASLDCLVAEQGCIQEQSCMVVYRLLEYCAAEEAVSPLGPDARLECLEAQNSLQHYRPLQVCKCQRGSRREEHCLRVYWTVRFAAYDEYEVSPYEELQVNLVRNIEMSRMASIMAASSLSVDGQNQCLKAAQDCGLFEKCGSLRSEYVVACTKRATVSDNSCNRQKCHKALRRFLERVPEEYSFALLFCPCTDTLCGERRRKTIVPSCSYEENGRGEERVGKPNCLSLQNYCSRDELCRSRLADFQHNCQPSPLSASGCIRESRAMCLKAYAGLIGTIMTPNYVSNSSTEVSQWCTCDGSGNEWQGCQRILHMFSNNICLRNAISSMGISAPPPVENTPVPASQPSPRIYQERVHVSINTLPEFNSMEDSKDEEQEEEESEEFNVIPPYSEKDSNIESGARGSKRGAASRAVPLLPLLLLPMLILDWQCWSY